MQKIDHTRQQTGRIDLILSHCASGSASRWKTIGESIYCQNFECDRIFSFSFNQIEKDMKKLESTVSRGQKIDQNHAKSLLYRAKQIKCGGTSFPILNFAILEEKVRQLTERIAKIISKFLGVIAEIFVFLLFDFTIIFNFNEKIIFKIEPRARTIPLKCYPTLQTNAPNL